MTADSRIAKSDCSHSLKPFVMRGQRIRIDGQILTAVIRESDLELEVRAITALSFHRFARDGQTIGADL